MTTEAEVRALLDQLRADLDRILSFLQHKLLWMALIENNELRFSTPVNDGEFEPPRLIMLIKREPHELRAERPHFENEMRRAYLNDLYLVASRYAIILANLLSGKEEPRPEFSEERRDAALQGIFRFLSKEDKEFLDFFRRVRISVVHYEGRHNRSNRLNYTFRNTRFKTEDKDLGESIFFGMRHILGFYEDLIRIFDPEAIIGHPQMQREIGE